MLLLTARGFDQSERTLTCLADTALLGGWIKRWPGAPAVESLLRATANLLWRPETASALDKPGPEAWAIFLGRVYTEPERVLSELEKAPQRLYVLRQAAAIMMNLGPAWRPWEIVAVELRINRSLLPDELDLNRRARELVVQCDDYTLCHLIIYLSDFGSAAIAEPMRGALFARCDRSCREHDRLERAEDLGFELVWAWHCLTGEWPPTIARWRDQKVPELANLCRQYEASLSTEDLEPFYRFYHMLLLSLCIFNGGSSGSSR